MDLQAVVPVPPSPPYPPRLDWVARTDGTGTVTSVMAPAAFIAATAGFPFPTAYFQFPDATANRSNLLAGDILKDLGSVVHTYDNLGNPNPIHFATHRRVQLVAGGDNTTATDPHVPVNIVSEGPWGSASNHYNTFWIRTWTADPQWFRTAAIARLG